MNSSLPKIKGLIFYGSILVSVLLAFSHQTKTLGQASLILLTLVIFTKPLARLFPTINLFKVLLAVRRETGQAGAFAAFGHVASQVFRGVPLFDLLQFSFSGGPQSFQFWGFWTLILMAILFLTSNDISTRLLKRNWFRLHQLIHPLYIFAMIHYGLRGGYLKLILVVFVLFVLYLSRFLAARGTKFFASSPVI
ncbi:MAG TPA: ferric reductase-like transmembrane domain-containing protein [Patescibacteria group bacterium]|nr:ferric reductase-like transmembrane domain-containing protein [Patescibacteria group bacterium]